MSTNEPAPLPGSTSSDHAVAVRQAALPEHQETPWSAPAVWTELAQPAALNLSLYMHGLRRHWVLATAIGLLCASAAALGVFFGVGVQYKYQAYVEVSGREERMLATMPGRRAPTQRAYDFYKHTHMALMSSDFVLLAALRTKVKLPGEPEKEVGQLNCIKDEEDKVAWLKDELDVATGESELIEVSLTGEDPEELKAVVQAVVDAYMREVVGNQVRDKRAKLQDLEAARNELDDKVRKKRETLRRLAESMGTSHTKELSVREEQALRQYDMLRRQQVTLEFDLSRASGELKGQETLLEELDTTPITESIPDLEVDTYLKNDPMGKQFAQELAYLQEFVDRSEAAVRQGSASAFVEEFRSNMQDAETRLNALRDSTREKLREVKRAEMKQIVREKKLEVEVLAEQLAKVNKDLQKQEAEVKHIGGTSVGIEMQRIDIENEEQVLRSIATEVEALRVELGADPPIKTYPYDETPQTPDNTPILVTLMVLAGLVGLGIPVVGVAWWDTRAKRINTAAEVSKNLGLTVLGSVPMIPSHVIRGLDSSSKRHQNWQIRLTESIDGIAARLLRKAALESKRVILVSSAVGSEGKTTLATQLAMSLARNGRDTVLVDFDLRRPAFDGVFGLPLEPGVSEVLRHETGLDGLVHATGTDNLSVVTAGRWDRHALAALANGAAGVMFEKLRAEHEFIVVDASPILPVADTRFVSQYVDTVILSVFRDISQAPKVEAACEILEAFGVDSLEAVVTGSTENLRDKDVGYQPRLSA